MKPVKKLPSELCSLVRSGVVIPTPAQAVVELVLNSIDAEATSIAVRVDLRLFKIQVIDNGHGITSQDLEAIGNRSVTSKCYTLDEFYNNLRYHGYRGESLASLREMCGLLEIVTHSSDCDDTYSKLFIHGKEEKVKISDLKRPSHGTTVTVTDFMFNMPVRRGRMKEAVELEAIRSCIEFIALAHPEISISVRNDSKGRIILEKHKSSDLLNAFEHLFGHNLARTLAPVNFATENFKISGYISKEAYRHNDLQFIYVNRQSVTKTKLHKLVSALLSKSSIIRTNGPWKSKPIPKNVPVERWLTFPSLEKQKKFAVFVINITCARKEYEMCWDTKKPMIFFKDWEGILSCISEAIQEFLRIENLVEEEQDSSSKIDEDKVGNNASVLLQRMPHSSREEKESSLENNQKVVFEVETWDIQGAVHGICAKRPKEKTQITNLCKESNDHSLRLANENQRQFLSPDSVNIRNECVQSAKSSVPPVVKFLGKYDMPSAARLQITKGAYQLKKLEEEEKRSKIAEKLGKFKLRSKPKLNSMKNNNKIEKKKSSSVNFRTREVTKYHGSLKLSSKNVHKGMTSCTKGVDDPFTFNSSNTSLRSETQDKLFLSVGESSARTFDTDLQSKSHISVATEHSGTGENLSTYLCSSPVSIDNSANGSDMQLAFNISRCTTEQIHQKQNSEASPEVFTNTVTCRKSPRECPPYGVNDTDRTNITQKKKVSYTNVQSTYFENKNIFCDEKITVQKHGNWRTHLFDVKEHHDNENGIVSLDNSSSKPCVNLGVSEIMVVSIPTPQIENLPVSNVTSLLTDKYDCPKEISTKDQVDLSVTLKNQICLSDPSTSFVNIEQSHNYKSHAHKPKVIEGLFACDSAERNIGKQNTLKFISSSAISSASEKVKDMEHARNLFHEITPAIYFPCENETEDQLYMDKNRNDFNTVKRALPSGTGSIFQEELRSFKNIFEPFEHCITRSKTVESRSPYFPFKNESHCLEISQSNNFELGNGSKREEIVIEKNNGSNFVQDNQKEDCNELMPEFGTSRSMLIELFPGSLDSKKCEGKLNVCPLFNIFSETSQERNPKTFVEELMVIPEEKDSVEISTVSSVTDGRNDEMSTFPPLKQSAENLIEDADNPKRIRLSQNESEIATTDERNVGKNVLDECVKKIGPFDSNFPVTSASDCQNGNVCEQSVSDKHKDAQPQKELEHSEDKTVEKDWLQLKNLEGKLFYFHAPSGFTSYDAPTIAKDASLYSMSKRFEFLPKGMSPLLKAPSAIHALPYSSMQQSDFGKTAPDSSNWTSSEDKDDLKTVKWRENPDIFKNDISEVLNIAKTLPDKKALSSNTRIPDLSFISAKMSGLLLQQKFDKRIFANIQVIGQLDNKFIVTLCSLDKNSSPSVLGMFDQHAVHERIRLELLMKEYSEDENEGTFTATDLQEPLNLIVSSKESHIMSNFQNKFEKLGLHFTLMDNDSVEIHRVPTCLYTRFLRERSGQWLENTLHILIQDVVLFLIKTSGQDLVVPEVFKEVINSEACKGAIKFGDPLTITQCEDLLSILSKCNLPFYCAHGRPSFMPIFDLRQFEAERRKYIPGY